MSCPHDAVKFVFLSFSDDSKWLSSLDDTDWLIQVSELLQTATQISVAMECDKSSVLISYEDGIDRTAQVCFIPYPTVTLHFIGR